MIRSVRRSGPRWLGVGASMILLGMVAVVLAVQTPRVRGHIPYINAPPLTPTPAGLVLSLGQSSLDDTASTPAASASAPDAAATSVSAPTDVPATVAPAATLVAVADTPVPTATAAMQTVVPAVASPVAVAPTVAAPPTAPPNPKPTAIPATAAPPAAPAAPAPLAALPPAVFLEPMAHWYQGWNQCAEMASSMALSYFGIKEDPNQVTAQLRPNNGPKGSKNVESYRIVEWINTQGVHAQAFEGGSVDRVKRLVASGVPVIVGEWQNRADHAGIGHWRVVRGYDDAKGIFILNDSMLDPAFQIKYAEFDDLWPLYDYVYIPVWNDRLAPSVQRVIGEEMDPKVNVAHAVSYLQSRAEQQPQNAELQFGLGGAYFKAGNYEKAAEQFHKAKNMGLLQKTPWALWYQSWPVVALGKVGMDDEALQLAQDNIKSAGVFALMHYDRAQIFEKRGDMAGAKREYQMALVDDKNLKEAQDALARMG